MGIIKRYNFKSKDELKYIREPDIGPTK